MIAWSIACGMRVFAAVFVCVVATTAAVADHDRWYEIEIAGTPSGYMREQIERADGLLTTTRTEQLAVMRGTTRTRIDQFVEFAETFAGEPRRAVVRTSAGGDDVVATYVFSDDGVEVTHQHHGRTWSEAVPGLADDHDWLTPGEVQLFIEKRLAAGARTLRWRTVEPAQNMKVVTVESSRLGSESRECFGRTLQLTKWRTETSDSPIALMEWRDTNGVVLIAEANLGIGLMRVHRVEQAQAERALRSQGAELTVSTAIPVANMPASSESLLRARFLVRATDGQAVQLPESGAQRVQRRAADALEVDINAANGSPATAEDAAYAPYREATVLLDSADPEIIEFVQRSLRASAKTASPLERAEILRKAVRRHVHSKDYKSAFASASDVVRSRAGDCTEHACLLAAALRADGQPARVATGLVHGRFVGAEQGGFAWHMWTQVLVEDQWFDLDATRRLRFDAGHVLVATSALDAENSDTELAGVLPLIGRLSIERLPVDDKEQGAPRQ